MAICFSTKVKHYEAVTEQPQVATMSIVKLIAFF